MSGRDRVPLSAQERQTLAYLEERIRHDDPDFALRMRHRSWRWLRDAARRVRLPALPGWMGPVLALSGLVGTVLVAGPLPLLSLVTIGVTVVGSYRIAGTLRARLAGRAVPAEGHKE